MFAKTVRLVLAVVGLAALAAGCPGSEDTTPDASNPGTTACNTVVNNAPTITAMHASGTVPVGQGGTIVPGTYFRTATTYYDGQTGPDASKTYKEVLVITQGSAANAFTVQGNMADQNIYTATFVVEGSSFHSAVTCPVVAEGEGDSYTATATELRIYKSSADKEMVFTRQAGETVTPDASTPGPGACNSVVNDAPQITGTHSTGTVPVGQGGTIAPGTYHRTATIYYDGQTGPYPSKIYKEVLVITPGAAANVFTVQGNMADQNIYTATFVVDGTSFHSAITCPLVAEGEGDSYTATATELRIFKSSADKEMVFTKQ